MMCQHCRDALDAYVDDQLSGEERREVADHLENCADCRAEHQTLSELRKSVKEELARYRAPDVLKARIRATIDRGDALTITPAAAKRQTWKLAAAAAAIAVASSALTFAAMNRSAPPLRVADDVVASHIRSLMPGHLTDVVSSDQHNVKPWFNGRVDMSPAVPDLSAAGFPLVGGRLDYVGGRTVPVIVYARREHVINVYAWPLAGAAASPATTSTVNGYHLVEWKQDGVEQWVVSDLNLGELNQFVQRLRRK